MTEQIPPAADARDVASDVVLDLVTRQALALREQADALLAAVELLRTAGRPTPVASMADQIAAMDATGAPAPHDPALVKQIHGVFGRARTRAALAADAAPAPSAAGDTIPPTSTLNQAG